MLQRAYYTNDDLDTVIADAKTAMKAISCSVGLTGHRSSSGWPRRFARSAAAASSRARRPASPLGQPRTIGADRPQPTRPIAEIA